MICPNCRNRVSRKNIYCSNCGARIRTNADENNGIVGYLCPVCKTPNPKHVEYCVKCGNWLLSTINQAQPITQDEYNKYFSGNGRLNIIGYWIFIAALIFLYILGSADIKMILSFLVIITVFISIIKPLTFLKIRNRLQGFLVLIFGIILLFISASFLPPLETSSTIQHLQALKRVISL
mgnify:CR=1 FL=1